MTSSTFFKNRSLGFKLNSILILALVVLLVITLVILSTGMKSMTLRTGQQSVALETVVISSRFKEAEQEILTAVKLLSTRPGLIEAVTEGDTDTIRTISLTGRGALKLDRVEVINANGTRLNPAAEVIDVTAEDALLSLGLLGIEDTGAVIGKNNESAEQTFLLAATVPLRNTSGTIVGALLAGRKVDDQYLTTLNFSREEIQLSLVHNGQILAQTVNISPQEQLTENQTTLPAGMGTAADITRMLDESALEQTLNGQTVIVPDLVYLANDEPWAVAYTPLTISDNIHSTLVVAAKVGQLLAFQRQLTTSTVLAFSLLILLALVTVALFIWRNVTTPLGKLKSAAEQITGGDYSQQIEVTTSDEIGQLGNAFNQMTKALRQTIESEQATRKEMEAQIWHTTGQTQLNDKMRGELDISTLASNIVSQLCRYLKTQIGALYIAENDHLRLVGSFAYNGKEPASRFRFGQGLVGQAVLEKRPMVITDVPDGYITISSGLGETAPKNLIIFPFLYENRVVGVIELGTLTKFSQTQLNFIETALDSIAIAFNTAQARARINELLEETQRQAEELQAQSEELRATNDELETQAENLRASETKLREQQAELAATNTQLEEQASALEESSLVLRAKQAALDLQNQELKTAQQTLEQKAEELIRASKYKSEFLANMSHELRTPLNSLLILARMLVDNEEGNLTEDQIESAQIIYSGGQDLLNLINDILDLAKVESGKMSFNFQTMLLSELTTLAQTQFAHVAAEKGLDLNISLADDLPASIETDPQRIKQIVKNLLSNAFKFTHQGSVSLNIHRPDVRANLLWSEPDSTQVVAISITDTGIGMTLEQQKIIFEAFQQADGSTSRQYGGTGLGLSISRELTAKLGGQIDVVSEPDKGSTFTLYLPIKEQKNTEKQKNKEIREATPPQLNSPAVPPATQSAPQPVSLPDDRAAIEVGDKILLIVEDDPKFAKIVYDFARKKDFKCLLAGNGEDSLELAKSYNLEAIILDLHLPDMSGWNVLEVLKNDPTTRHIPVHIISADEEVLDAYKKGAMGYLTKPVNQARLAQSFEKIEQFIAKKIKTLLLIEDDANARRSIKKLLDGSDVQISEAEAGEAALSLLYSQHFDCMILDLSLPDMSGFEVLNRMNGNQHCPVIVYTGRDLTPEENVELMKYTDSVIVKGVKSPERLLDETALFLHRVVADLPQDKQKTIRRLYNHDDLLKDKKILIVDDDMRNSFALSKLLSEKGMRIKIAPNGQKALDILDQEPTDLILMDIMMPVMDGYETIRRIRSLPHLNGLPILALTAKAMKDDREKCLAAGANDYLPKPVDIDRLFSMLRVWLY